MKKAAKNATPADIPSAKRSSEIMYYKYAIFIGTVFVGSLIIYSYTCQPLSPKIVTQIIKSKFDIACYLLRSDIEPPELNIPRNNLLHPNNYIYGTALSGTSTSRTQAFMTRAIG